MREVTAIRLSEEEREALREAARGLHIPFTTFARAAAVAEARRWLELRTELNRDGRRQWLAPSETEKPPNLPVAALAMCPKSKGRRRCKITFGSGATPR